MSKAGTAWRYTKIAVKALFVLLIIFVYGLLFVRMCSVDDIPDEFKNIYVTDELRALYGDGNSDDIEGKFIYQNLTKYNTDKDSYGYFSAASVMIVPQAGQVQVIMKYNISTLDHVKEDYGLSVSIDRNRTDTFEFSLVVKNANSAIVEDASETVDYNGASNYTIDRIYPVKTEFLTAGRHNYIRCVFDGAELDLDRLLGVFCDVNYKDDIKYEQVDDEGKALNSYASICIYNYTAKVKDYKLTKVDIEALTK